MGNILTIRQAVQRAKSEGLPVSEYTLRAWIKGGAIPVRTAGHKALLYYEAGGVHYKMNMDMTAIQMNPVYHLVVPKQPPGCKSQIHQLLKICQHCFLVRKRNKEVFQLESIRLVKCLFDEKHLFQRCVAAAVHSITAYDHSFIQNVVNHIL